MTVEQQRAVEAAIQNGDLPKAQRIIDAAKVLDEAAAEGIASPPKMLFQDAVITILAAYVRNNPLHFDAEERNLLLYSLKEYDSEPEQAEETPVP